mmetsp:Transcript_26013/g.68482  ORF Transcript_26013/g.68482 Transcript_26013/m.68482 type:complete len:107 (-) Transcript_26013:243-563(-)
MLDCSTVRKTGKHWAEGETDSQPISKKRRGSLTDSDKKDANDSRINLSIQSKVRRIDHDVDLLESGNKLHYIFLGKQVLASDLRQSQSLCCPLFKTRGLEDWRDLL